MLCRCLLAFLSLSTSSGFQIQNKLLGKCLQVQEGLWGGRVSLEDCHPDSPVQEWLWLPEGPALSSRHSGECLTAPEEQYQGVKLQPCTDSEQSGQTWSCSRKGHVTLEGRGLHLSASPQSTLVFLSREHKQGSRWRTLGNQTLCDWREQQQLIDPPPVSSSSSSSRSIEAVSVPQEEEEGAVGGRTDSEATEMPSFPDGTFVSTKSPTMVFYSLDYGMSWKVTMLVLTSLALVLGTVILILNVYSNRRKKVVCVLKSYAVRSEVSVPGSPVPSERAPLTQHALRPPHSSPPVMQRGEILIEWKDGSVTPLYEA